jgi:hypothetical protein
MNENSADSLAVSQTINLPGFVDGCKLEESLLADPASNQCRTKGIAVSTVDMLICSVAVQGSLHIYTADPDFQNYARVHPIKFCEVAGKP